LAICFYTEDVKIPAFPKLKVKRWFKHVIQSKGFVPGNISIIFCSDEHLLSLNKQYLAHDYYTDIITFDYTEDNVVSGDLFISIDRIAENAVLENVLFENELLRVMIHGILHLMGYKDKLPSEAVTMKLGEDESLVVYQTIV
jgi:rRNA maturation RNase YbeY